jgi:hypothetical protein
MQPEKNKVTSQEVTSDRFKETEGDWVSKFVDLEDLTALVITAARACDVRGSGTAALGAHVELPGTPLLACATEALFHLGGFAFWDCHSELRVLWSAHLN